VVELCGRRPLLNSKVQDEVLDARLVAKFRKRGTVALQESHRILNLDVDTGTISLAYDEVEPGVSVLEGLPSWTLATLAPHSTGLEAATRKERINVETPARDSQNASHWLCSPS